jgi:hypothetical protein
LRLWKSNALSEFDLRALLALDMRQCWAYHFAACLVKAVIDTIFGIFCDRIFGRVIQYL